MFYIYKFEQGAIHARPQQSQVDSEKQLLHEYRFWYKTGVGDPS